MEYGFAEKIKKREFVVLVELDPPKGTDLGKFMAHAQNTAGRADAIAIPDSQNAVMRMSPIAASFHLVRENLEPLICLNIRDRNQLSFQSELLGASALGISNVLLEEGLAPTLGDHPMTRPCNDLSLVRAVYATRIIQEGVDFAGNRLEGAPELFVGARLDPYKFQQQSEQMIALISEGVDFFVATPVFHIDILKRFVDEVGPSSPPVIAAVTLIKSVGMARMVNRIFDEPLVPDLLIERMFAAKDKEEESLAIAAEAVEEAKQICSGVVLRTIGWESKIPELLDRIGS